MAPYLPSGRVSFAAPFFAVLVLLVLAFAGVHCGTSAAAPEKLDASASADGSRSFEGGSDASAEAADAVAADASRVPFDGGSLPQGACPTGFFELPGIPCEAIDVTATATGDFNGDGKVDVAAVGGDVYGHGNAGLLIALGEGDGRFTIGAVTQTAGGNLYSETNAAGLAAGDFNRDGLTDLVAADPISGFVTVVLGGADGGMNENDGGVSAFGTGEGPMGVAVGDVNGDGNLDVVTANEGSGDVSVLLGDGHGALGAPLDYPAVGDAGAPGAVLVADFNGDRQLDVAVLDGISSGAQVAVLIGADGGGLSTPILNASVPGAVSFAALDANGDGHVDLAIADNANNAVDLLLGVGDGTFGAPTAVSLGAPPGPIAAADVNGDGEPDVIVSTASGVDVLLNAAGSLSPPKNVPVALAAGTMSVADLNGDTKPDIVLAPFNTPLQILLNEGGGAFPPPAFVSYPTGAGADVVAAADLDGDGRLDLAVANGGARTVSVLKNVGSGAFAPAIAYVESSAPLPSASSIGPVALAAIDLNRDGKRDLVVLDSAAGLVNVLLNEGGGIFGAPSSNSAGGTPTSDAQAMVTGDWNGDGLLDVAVANVFGPENADDGNLAVLFGNGDGTFAPPVTLGDAIQPGALASADLEGTGVDALVVSSLGSLSVVTFDTGNNATVSSIATNLGDNPGSVAVADYDGDGKPDIAVVQSGLDVLLGNGDGTFSAPTTFSLDGSLGVSLLAADVDADGRPDIVGTDRWMGIFVMYNQGGGAFGLPVFYATGNQPTSVAVADLDAEGSLDFATANLGSGVASVLLSPPCPLMK